MAVSLVDVDNIRPTLVAAAGPIFIPIVTPTIPVVTPFLSADIKLLKKPFTPVPGKVFDAAALRQQLWPLVTGKKCERENVCPHYHRYLTKEIPVG